MNDYTKPNQKIKDEEVKVLRYAVAFLTLAGIVFLALAVRFIGLFG